MKEVPIVIAGFGRSGTTWLSDILSKVIGGLILFEPFHPSVFSQSEQFCYSTKGVDINILKSHLSKCFNRQPENFWILRNHLREPIQNTSNSYVKYIWNNSEILGLKTIRCNHILNQIQGVLSGKIVYIHRHPFAVLVSILNRENFWKEFGWDWHVECFFSRTLRKKNFHSDHLDHLKGLRAHAKTKDELIILMWGISLIISLRQVDLSAGYIISYEKLYLDPYSQIKNLLNYLNHNNLRLHPSHIFTPSLTTLNTIHPNVGVQELSTRNLDALFWKDYMGKTQRHNLLKMLSAILETDKKAKALVESSEYL